MSSSLSFAYQYPAFKDSFNVYAPDLKGFGTNADVDYPYSLDDYCGDVLRFIEENDLKKPHVIAHSFGGRIAIKLAAQRKELFDKIVLTGAAGLKPKPSVKKWFKRQAFKAAKLVVPKEKLSSFYSSDYRALSPIMQKSFIKIVNEHLDDLLCKISNPVLIINGEKDKQTPIYMAKRLKNGIFNSQMIILKDAGHFCFIDKARKFNTEVKEFLLS